MHSSRSHDALIRVYDDAGSLIETHEHNSWIGWRMREAQFTGFLHRVSSKKTQ
jgi:hypothetical protein